MFQSTHLHEVWHAMDKVNNYKLNVSIHTPTWGVTSTRGQYRGNRKFQSTHLHEVWQQANCLTREHNVSIHTPTWGVTDCRRKESHSCMVSIHTPTWGVTSRNVTRSRRWRFQSTHLHEVWPGNTAWWQDAQRFQSTHLHEVWPKKS